MKLHRIYAIILRNFYTFRRNYDRIFDAFYWPTLEVVIWGITSRYLLSLSPDFAYVLILIVSGLTFWFIVSRSQYEANVALLEDIWAKNLINLFVSPLKFSEWIIGVITIGVFKAMISFCTAATVAFLLYKFSIFTYGFYLLPFILLLMMTGWWVSFFIAGAILRYGTKVQTFAWTLISLLSPFSGVFYPISSLPESIQYISYMLPTTYVFAGMREIIFTHTLDPYKLVMAFILNCIFLTLGMWYMKNSYNKTLDKGMLQII